jgi:hypothetical protein
MATKETKLPAIPPIPSNVDPQLKTYLNAVDEALKVRLGTVGDPKDRAVTVRELIDSGLAENFLEEPFNLDAGTPPNTFIPIDGLVDLAVPPDVTSFSGTGTFQKIILSWDLAQFGNFAFTEVWRHTSNNLGSATRIDTTRAQVWSDTVDFNSNFYYWVRHVSTSNIVGQFAGAINVTTSKITSSNVDTALEAGSITATEIAAGSVSADKITASAITADKIAADAVTTAKIQAGAITAASAILADASVTNAKIASAAITDAKINNLSAAKIIASTLDVASKGIVGSAGNIVAGTGSVITTTQSTTGNPTAPVVFWGHNQPSLLTTYGASSPYYQYGGATLPEIASKSFTTTSRTQNYNFVGFHGESGDFDGDEEKFIVIAVQQSNGTLVDSRFQYVNFAQAGDLFSIALNVTLAANTTFVAKLYGGLKNVNLHSTLGRISLSGNIMVFGLGL